MSNGIENKVKITTEMFQYTVHVIINNYIIMS